MGFSCGIYKVKKFKDGTFESYLNTQRYLMWKNNPWNTRVNENTGEAPYPTYEDYVKSYNGDKYIGEPSQEEIDFYEDNDVETLVEGYSIAEPLHDLLRDEEFIKDDYVLFTSKEFSELKDILYKYIDRTEPFEKFVWPVKATYEVEDEERIVNIKSVVVEDSDGASYFINSETQEYDEHQLFIRKTDSNNWFRDRLVFAMEIIDETDLDKYFVYYNGGR